MVALLIAHVALLDRLVFGSSSAVSVGVLVGAISFPLVLELIIRVGFQIVWVVLVAISKVTSSRVSLSTATAAIAAYAREKKSRIIRITQSETHCITRLGQNTHGIYTTTLNKILSPAAFAAVVAATTAACCFAFNADLLPALPSHVTILATITARAVELFAASRPIVYNYIGRLLFVIKACHESFITADHFDTKIM